MQSYAKMNQPNVNKLVSFFVKTAYLIAYFNIIIHIGYLILFTLGMVSAPLDERGGVQSPFWMVVGFCLLMPFSCWLVLHWRYEVDLMTMQQGSSALSRFIFVSISLVGNAFFIYWFFDVIVDWI